MTARNRRHRGREPRQFANSRVAPRYQDFTDDWLQGVSERQYADYIDLTRQEDRRRWHPNRLRNIPAGPAPQGLQTRPRIVVVPEGHSLARHAPYGGRVPLKKLFDRDGRVRRRYLDDWAEKVVYDRYGGKQTVYGPSHVSRRVGFSHPWQVIICIRRKRRKEVLHALRKTGGGGGKKQKRPRRNEWSEVRC